VNWRQTLVGYERMYWGQPQWTIYRQDFYPENILFVDNQIVFVGINLVSGYVHDETEWSDREQADLDWIDEAYWGYRRDARVMVVFAHASPQYTQNAGFFEPFLRAVEDDYTEMHFVLVHRNSPTEVWEVTQRYDGIDNLDVITVMGSVWPPQQATIDLSSDEISVSLRETTST